MHCTSRWFSPAVMALACMALAGCDDEATAPALGRGSTARPASGVAATGNGAPSGAHYTLNLIGVPKEKSPDFGGGNGHRIFVGLGRSGSATTRINLGPGDFAVIDANGTDGSAAFQLPNPDPDGDGTTLYSVYVRVLGKPGGTGTLQSCYEDDLGTWCAADLAGGVEPIPLTRTKGGAPKFTNVSKDLLYVDHCLAWDAGVDTILGTDDDVCTDIEQIGLFSNELLSYYWNYDNRGLKLVQLRFYEVPTDTSLE
jgi:hypothetical protein